QVDAMAQIEWLPPAPPVAPAEDLKHRIATRAAFYVGPPRRVVVQQTVMLTIGSWLIGVLVFLYAGGLRETGRPLSLVLGTAAGISAIAGVSGWAALGRGRSTLGRAR